READRPRRSTGLEDDDLARLDVTDELGADDVEAGGLAREDPARSRRLVVRIAPEPGCHGAIRGGRDRQPPEDERPEAVRIANADHPPLVEDHEAVRAANPGQDADEG